MALASLRTRPAATVAGSARRVEVTPRSTLLVLDDGRRIPMAARPDSDGAGRCRQGLNHVVSVRIEGSSDQPTARLRGIGNRLPVTLAIPIGTALALVDAGVPASVWLTEAVDA